ncbi:MAG: hypothetical protein ACRERW_04375, partial [Pseudomonas sp.]
AVHLGRSELASRCDLPDKTQSRDKPAPTGLAPLLLSEQHCERCSGFFVPLSYVSFGYFNQVHYLRNAGKFAMFKFVGKSTFAG